MLEFMKRQIDMMTNDERENYIEFIATDDTITICKYQEIYKYALQKLQGGI